MSFELLSLIILFAMGIYAASIAHKHKKNPYLWFILGFYFGILSLVLLYFLIRKKKSKKKTIIKKPPSPIEKFFLNNLSLNKLWYHLDNNNNTLGPISSMKLYEEWKKGTITNSTYVWNEEMDQWEKIENLFPITN